MSVCMYFYWHKGYFGVCALKHCLYQIVVSCVVCSFFPNILCMYVHIFFSYRYMQMYVCIYVCMCVRIPLSCRTSSFHVTSNGNKITKPELLLKRRVDSSSMCSRVGNNDRQTSETVMRRGRTFCCLFVVFLPFRHLCFLFSFICFCSVLCYCS